MGNIMICSTCGRMVRNEEANFCEYCGFSFRENSKPAISLTESKETTVVKKQGEKATSFLNWLSIYGLLFIPVFGWLLFMIILFYWSFDQNTSATKKNWARATLIFAGVYLLFMAMVLMSMKGNPLFQELLSGV